LTFRLDTAPGARVDNAFGAAEIPEWNRHCERLSVGSLQDFAVVEQLKISPPAQRRSVRRIFKREEAKDVKSCC